MIDWYAVAFALLTLAFTWLALAFLNNGRKEPAVWMGLNAILSLVATLAKIFE